MEPARFDALTRRLATSTSRRRMMHGLAIGALASVGLAKVASADASKVALCHLTTSSTNSWVPVTVAPSAVQGHLDAGDAYMGSDGTCNSCQVCSGGTSTCDPEGCGGCTQWLPEMGYCASDNTGNSCVVTSLDNIEGPYVAVDQPFLDYCGYYYCTNIGGATCINGVCTCPPDPSTA